MIGKLLILSVFVCGVWSCGQQPGGTTVAPGNVNTEPAPPTQAPATQATNPPGRKKRDANEANIILVLGRAYSQEVQQILDQEFKALIEREHVPKGRYGSVKKSVQNQHGQGSIVYHLPQGGEHCDELLKLVGEAVGYSKVVKKAIVNCGGHSTAINKN